MAHHCLASCLRLNLEASLAQVQLRSINELTADTSGRELLYDLANKATNHYEILPADYNKSKDALYQTQVTTRSMMGAIIYFTGGILIDNGWLRIIGSGEKRLDRSLPEWNKGKAFKEYGEQPGFLLIADDITGGFFAINGGALGSDKGRIYYLAPDKLKWEALGITYTDFIDFCFVGDLNEFYAGLRWSGWEKDVLIISGNEGYSFYPYLWTREGKDINKASRKAVLIQELYDFITSQQVNY